MTVKLAYFISAVSLAISLTSCATSHPSDDFSFNYSSAEIGDFNGTWKGRVDCRYADKFKPLAWVKISDGRGEFGFGPGSATGFNFGSLYADLDSQNGKIRWSGKIKPSHNAKKMPVSFSGHWRESYFKLEGRIDSKNCSGVLTKL